jgi:hypothetical protein
VAAAATGGSPLVVAVVGVTTTRLGRTDLDETPPVSPASPGVAFAPLAAGVDAGEAEPCGGDTVGVGGGGMVPHTDASVVAGGGEWVAPELPEPQLHPSTSPSCMGVDAAPEPDHDHPPEPSPSQNPQKLG